MKECADLCTSFLAGAHRKLSMALIKCQGSVLGPCIMVKPTSWQGLRAVSCRQWLGYPYED